MLSLYNPTKDAYVRGFHANSNAYKLGELIPFSNSNYVGFNTKEDAQEYIDQCKNELESIKVDEANKGNIQKAQKILNKLQII